jgi:hypothetical protein
MATTYAAPTAIPVARPAHAPAALVGVLTVQGLYYLLTGLWPLVHLSSFEAVTGPKTDDWLVQTVGVLIAVVALALLTAAARRRAPAEVIVLALGSAVALTGVDVVFVAQGVIPPIYLLDAALEVLLILWWLAGLSSVPRY